MLFAFARPALTRIAQEDLFALMSAIKAKLYQLRNQEQATKVPFNWIELNSHRDSILQHANLPLRRIHGSNRTLCCQK